MLSLSYGTTSTLGILAWVRDGNKAYGDMSTYREESVNISYLLQFMHGKISYIETQIIV